MTRARLLDVIVGLVLAALLAARFPALRGLREALSLSDDANALLLPGLAVVLAGIAAAVRRFSPRA